MKRPSIHSPAAKRSAQSGFTFVSTTISMIIAGVVLTGAWLAYSDLQVQWRIANADRVMDQYAAASMQDLTNTFCWAWGAKLVQGGSRDPHWKFYIDDIVAERAMSLSRWDQDYHIGPDRLLELTFRPTSGILFNSFTPEWAADRLGTSYMWIGRGGTPRGVVRSFDRRDRMTVESLQISFNTFPYLSNPAGHPNENLRRSQVVKVELVMHYTYNAPYWFQMGSRLYGSSYVRERKYVTQIAMRNWDVEINDFRDKVLGLEAG